MDWKGWKQNCQIFLSDSGAGLSGEEDGKTEVTEDTVTTRRSNLIFILSFLLWLWFRKYWTEHTFHCSCLWLISLDLDIWNTPRPQVDTGELHQEWNPDDKGGQGGRTNACDFTINHPKGESYVRYLKTNTCSYEEMIQQKVLGSCKTSSTSLWSKCIQLKIQKEQVFHHLNCQENLLTGP